MRLQFQIKHLLILVLVSAAILGIGRMIGLPSLLGMIASLFVLLLFGLVSRFGASWGAAITRVLEERWTDSDDLLLMPVPIQYRIKRALCFLAGIVVTIGVFLAALYLLALIPLILESL